MLQKCSKNVAPTIGMLNHWNVSQSSAIFTSALSLPFVAFALGARDLVLFPDLGV